MEVVDAQLRGSPEEVRIRLPAGRCPSIRKAMELAEESAAADDFLKDGGGPAFVVPTWRPYYQPLGRRPAYRGIAGAVGS